MTEVVPYLYLKEAARAIEFYKRAFGARETYARITDGDGRVGHAEITIGTSTLMLADEHPEIGVVSPATLGGSHMSFVINVPNVDDVVKQAVAAGGRLSRPVENKFYGHRSGEITDPFGYRWTLSTKIEDLSEEEVRRRAREEAKKRTASG
jgi:PhnB protein